MKYKCLQTDFKNNQIKMDATKYLIIKVLVYKFYKLHLKKIKQTFYEAINIF